MRPAMPFDEATSRRVDATYTTADVVGQRRLILSALALKPGEDVLDIGTGPGYLACEMSAEVGPGGSVTGVDPSESMLSLARARPRPDGAGRVSFVPGEATALPCADSSFDAVTATQVYEYVADVPAALAEARRVLRPGGRLLVLDTDWDSIVWRSGDDARMERLLRVWDRHLADPHLPRRLTGLLAGAGFSATRLSAIPLLNAGYDADTFSAGLIGIISAFLATQADLTADEVSSWADDLAALGAGYFFSLNRYLFAAVRT